MQVEIEKTLALWRGLPSSKMKTQVKEIYAERMTAQTSTGRDK